MLVGNVLLGDLRSQHEPASGMASIAYGFDKKSCGISGNRPAKKEPTDAAKPSAARAAETDGAEGAVVWWAASW